MKSRLLAADWLWWGLLLCVCVCVCACVRACVCVYSTTNWLHSSDYYRPTDWTRCYCYGRHRVALGALHLNHRPSGVMQNLLHW